MLIIIVAVFLGAALLFIGAWFWLHHRAPGRDFDSNGVRIHYTDEGRGEPVILLHGRSGNSDIQWRRWGTIGRLAKDFRVIGMDVRGHGLSGHPHDPQAYGMEVIDDVVRLMDHLGIEKAHLVGFSMGGLIAMKTAVTHPDRVRTIAFCAAGWFRPEDLREPGETIIDLGFRLECLLARADCHAIDACWHTVKTWGVSESELRNCHAPIALYVGSKDGEVLKALERLKPVYPNLESLVIPRYGHPNLYMSRQFQEALLDFLLRHRLS